MVGDMEAKMSLRISLSCLTQWVLFKAVVEVPTGEEHREISLI
jgi:hypothetical protein